ncbi:SURF1 family protein [Arthrobacter jiangjiafuii]|uniref:SURF1-like protein n=1 Tax=Arthrobacter jiangjiafuii TaxID=2817475 RepID=A0A975QZQ1_9MICC|nr:SURF1 family protein [Arthrobacter jiangjiafuii]MBP3043181.1 SURF1 family protein [Arthrobacter jiangjiafuii]QWC08733.1 SURF1 family protein [Arthrobacter jiangjiafuii]
MYRFLLSGRWLGWLALVCALSAICVMLGSWQMDRRDAIREDIGNVVNNYDADPVPFEEAAGLFDSYDPSREWTPVEMTGVYDTQNQRIVRNRPLSGRAGYEVVVPLKLSDGTAVVINRGWLPIGNDEAGRPDTVPAAPSGEVTVVARIKPAEPALDRGAPEGQLASIDLARYQDEVGYELVQGAYGLMATEDPAPAEVPEAAPKPSVDEGPHLSYAMQWYAFGFMLFVGLGYAARQEALNLRYADEDEYEDEDDDEMIAAHPAPSERRRPRRQRGSTQENEEDALLDAQGY